jgi:hypothetical protein
MHTVSEKIQQDHCGDEAQRERHPGAIQQSMGALGKQLSDQGGAERIDGVHSDISKCEQTVAGPSAPIRLGERSPRAKGLAQADQHKCRNEQPPSDTNFVAGEVPLHNN